MSVCSVALSWICERSPSSIHSLSPRSTAPNQTLLSVLHPHLADDSRAWRDPKAALLRQVRLLPVEFVDHVIRLTLRISAAAFGASIGNCGLLTIDRH